MSVAIGIDFGETNACAARMSGSARVIQNRENEDLTPCCVGMHKGRVLIGRLAVNNTPQDPEDTIVSVRRLLGRGFRDPEVQRVRGKYPYQVVEPQDGTEDDVRVVMGARQHSPVEISSMILKKIKEDCELRFNEKVEYAVITVPAYFTDKQRSAVRQAARRAGLRVQKVLDEPSAAAIAFGIDNLGTGDSKTVLVYDLGGGSFDVSVLAIANGVIAPLNITGNQWLGGDEFDLRIVEHVVERVKAEHHMDPRSNRRFMAQLRLEAEKAKKALSSITSADIVIPGVPQDENKDWIDFEMELTRSQFERMIADRVEERIAGVREAMRGAQVTADQVDYVLLVGGSSLIPLVRRELAALFGEKKLMINVDPMKGVAYGAAILAARLKNSWECGGGHRNEAKDDVCGQCGASALELPAYRTVATGMPYGIESDGGAFDIVIPQHTVFPTPAPLMRRIYTRAPNLKRIKIPIYVGVKPVARENELQAIVCLQLPDNVPSGTPIDIGFSLDDDGILQRVRVRLRDASGAEVETFLDRGDSKRGRLEKQLEQLLRRRQELSEQINREAARDLEEYYDAAAAALSRNDPNIAERCVQRMETLLRTSSQARGGAG